MNRTKVFTWRIIIGYSIVFWVAFGIAIAYCLQ